MNMKVVVRESSPSIEVTDVAALNAVISSASAEACAEGLMSIIFIEAENGNRLGLVVGGDETALSFNYGHKDPPYYASKGTAEHDEPVLTAYVVYHHHTEISRKSVIPMKDGMLAVHEFFETGGLPACIEWMEV